MTPGALCLGLILALRLGGVTPLALQQDAGARGPNQGQARDALFHLRGLPQGSAVVPHKKAPQFMLDLFNAVSEPGGSPRSQKEILEGNIVRSFQDKGEGERSHRGCRVISERNRVDFWPRGCAKCSSLSRKCAITHDYARRTRTWKRQKIH